MVCSRCKMVVKAELEKVGLCPQTVDLGEIEIETALTKVQLVKLENSLRHFGFEMIDDRKGQIINKIKNTIVKLVHYSDEKY